MTGNNLLSRCVVACMYPFTSFAYRPIDESSEQLLRAEGPGSWCIVLEKSPDKAESHSSHVAWIPTGSGNDPLKVPQLVGSRDNNSSPLTFSLSLQGTSCSPLTLCVQLFNFFLMVFVRFCHSFLKVKVKSLSPV